MVHNKNVSEILSELKDIASTAVKNCLEEWNARYKEYCSITQVEYKPIETEIDICEYKDIYEKASRVYGPAIDEYIDTIARNSIEQGDDKRETSLHIVEELMRIANITNPTIVIFFATPHCPHNTLKEEIPEEKKLTEEIAVIADKFGKEHNEQFRMMYFFPSLTDSSYLKIDDDEESIKQLEANFPKQDLLYPVPYEQIRKLNIPGINYGCFGKDAHKWTERVQMDYSFGKLPYLIIDTINHYLT